MEKKLFILLFLTGIIPLVQSITHKFYLIQQNKTWTEAQTYCQTKHTDLATIETPADMIQLQAEAQEHQFSSSAWIGLYKVTDWHWSINNKPLGSWTFWNPGEPTNGNDACGAIYYRKWKDLMCTAYTRPFLCYDDKLVGDDRYIFYDISVTWDEAQHYCKQQHTDLAIIRNEEEQSMVEGKIPSIGSSIWIGLYRNFWSWLDQTKFSTITWASGEPDNYQGFEDCGSVENGLISDTPCSVTKPFFCYSVITGQQQMIRMKFQSDQDLNNPAAQAVILEQIQQNLRHHGIANVTIKFREQPGGAVFHKLEENQTAVK